MYRIVSDLGRSDSEFVLGLEGAQEQSLEGVGLAHFELGELHALKVENFERGILKGCAVFFDALLGGVFAGFGKLAHALFALWLWCRYWRHNCLLHGCKELYSHLNSLYVIVL